MHNEENKRRTIFPKVNDIYSMIKDENVSGIKEFLKNKEILVDRKRNKERITPLEFAAKSGNYEIFKTLLNYSKNINNIVNSLEKALHLSFRKNNKIVDSLVEKYKEIKKEERKVKRPRFKSKLESIKEDKVYYQKDDSFEEPKKVENTSNTNFSNKRLIFQHYSEIFKATFEGNTSELVRILKRDSNIVDKLLQTYNYPINYPGKYLTIKETPLTLAVKLKNTECINILIKHSNCIENIDNAITIGMMPEFRAKTVLLKSRKNEIIDLKRKYEYKAIAQVLKKHKNELIKMPVINENITL